jgi:hypothetical protein
MMFGTGKAREPDSGTIGPTGQSLPRQLATAAETAEKKGTGAFSVALVFGSRRCRDFVRGRLVEQGISASALRPREPVEACEEDRRLCDRLLFLDCPADDGQADLARAAAIAGEAIRQYEAIGTAGEDGSGPAPPPDERQRPQRAIEGQHDDWPHFISAQSSPVWGHRYGRRGIARNP